MTFCHGISFVLQRVALREGLSALTLITALSERQAEVVESDDICIAYHMDISPSAPRLTNLLLFELLLVGVVQDRKTGQVCALFLSMMLWRCCPLLFHRGHKSNAIVLNRGMWCCVLLWTVLLMPKLFVRSPRDAFVMEVASTPNGSLLQKLSICQMMEHVEVLLHFSLSVFVCVLEDVEFCELEMSIKPPFPLPNLD